MLAFEIFYISLMTVISLYGLHRYWIVLGTLRRRRVHESRVARPREPGDPEVLVQLPIYNEGDVVCRLVDSVAGLDWDPRQLIVQVLDDSDDGSSELVSERVQFWVTQGIRMEHLRRQERTGYKAGALEVGLRHSSAPFVAILDADFVVPAEFLRRSIPCFLADDRLAMVQARWGFLNRDRSLLTRVQALLLDGHFHVEHRARALAGRFFNFNGTAGIWRRRAIDDSGGWRAETITEDLDLSLRAWLRGWRFRYLDDLEVPSALPEAMPAFKIQQNRWVSGSVQTAKALLARVLGSSLPMLSKVDLFFCLTGNFIYLFLLLLALSIPPAVLLRFDATERLLLWADIPFFLLATGSVFAFYSAARPRQRPWSGFVLVEVPSLMALGLGMTLHNARAIVRGLFSRARVFERTPKGGVGRESVAIRRRPRRGFDPLALLEPFMAGYVAACFLVTLPGGSLLSLPFLALFVWGYLFVFYKTLRPES